MATGDLVQANDGIIGALPSAPTVGNTLIVYGTARLSAAADPPIGFTDCGTGIVSPVEHYGWAWYRHVQPGDSTPAWAGGVGGTAPDMYYIEEREGVLTPVATSLVSTNPYNTNSPWPGAAVTPPAGKVGAIVGYIFMKRDHGNLGADTGWTLLMSETSIVTHHSAVGQIVTSSSGTYTPMFTGTNPAVYDNGSYGAITLALLADTPAPPPPDPGVEITIGGVTISDAAEKTIRVEMDGTGQGMFKIDRRSAQATATNLAQGNLAKVVYPAISADPISAFFLDSGDFDLVSRDEEGGELLSFAGQGALSYLERAIMWSESFLTSDLSVVLGPGSRWVYTKSGANLVSRVSTLFASASVYTAGAIETLDYLPGGATYLDRPYVPLTSGPYSGKYVSTKWLATPYIDDRTWRLFASSTGSKPGQILRRVIAEAQHASRPQAPLAAMTIDFDYSIDSDGNAWASSDATAEFTAQMGESLLEVVLRLVDTGAIDVVMDPDLVLHAYNSYGTDRSSLTYATGKVRFERGVNIADVLRRSVGLKLPATHALIDGDDQVTATAALTDAGSRPTVETYISLEGSDATVLADTGLVILEDAVGQLESVAFPIDVGDDELNGQYLPGPAGTNGHFWVGDTVTLDTGTTTIDYTDDDLRVMALTIKEDDAGNIDCIPELSGVMGGLVRWGPMITRRGITGGRPIVKVVGTGEASPEGIPVVAADVEIAFDDLTDVDAPAPNDGDVPTWDDYLGLWLPVAPGAASIDWGEDADITTLDYDDAADAGALDEAARADHRHGMPSAGGGGVSPSYLGHNSVGANEQTAVFLRWYTKKITTTVAAILLGIEVYIKEAADSVEGLDVALFADNAGARGDILATGVSAPLALIGASSAMAYRWEGAAITRALDASTSYWIGWMYWKPLGGGPDIRHKYDTGGADRIFDEANVYVTDGGRQTETDTTFTYSARALIL